MFSDKKFGLSKDLIDTVKKVVEENKQPIEEAKFKRGPGGRFAAHPSALGGFSRLPNLKPATPFPHAPAAAPAPAPAAGSGAISAATSAKTPAPAAPAPAPAPAAGSGAISAAKAAEKAGVPGTKEMPSLVQKAGQALSKLGPKGALGAAALVGGAALTGAVLSGSGKKSEPTTPTPPSTTSSESDADKMKRLKREMPNLGSSRDEPSPEPSKSRPSAPSTPRQSAPSTPRQSVRSTPDLDKPDTVGGSFSKRRAAELGFGDSFEDGGPKKKGKAVRESALINAFLSLYEKQIIRDRNTLSSASQPQASNPRGSEVKKIERTRGGDYNVYGRNSKTASEFNTLYGDAKKSGAGSFDWQGRNYTVKNAPKGAGKYVKPADASAQRNEPGSGTQKALGGSTGTNPQVPVDPNVKASMNQTPSGRPDRTAMPDTVKARNANDRGIVDKDAEAASSQSARTLVAARTVAPMAQKADRPTEKPEGQEDRLTLGQRLKISREKAARGDLEGDRPWKINEINNAFLALHEKKHHKKHKLDTVGQEDDDVDNDGKVDSTDKYLKHRREVIGKNIKEENLEEGSERLSYHKKMVKKLMKEIEDEPNNDHLKDKLKYHKKMVKELSEEVDFSDEELEHIISVLEGIDNRKDSVEPTTPRNKNVSRSVGDTIPNRDLTDATEYCESCEKPKKKCKCQ